MDKVLYISSAGATLAMKAQQVHANNLANTSSTGFRKDFVSSLAVALEGDGLDSRVMPVARGLGSSYEPGVLQATGRKLDVAVAGDGWLTVEMPDGAEAYTRNGQLEINAERELVTAEGLSVIGDDGPIQLPEYKSISIGIDGTITIIPAGLGDAAIEAGQLKLVNPEPGSLRKTEGGLFQAVSGEEFEVAPDVQIKIGHLESSNVNALEEMVSFLSLSRQFESQMKLMKAAGDMAASGDRLVRDQ